MALLFPPFDDTPPDLMGLIQLRTLAPVRVASLVNVDPGALAPLDLIDTIALELGDRILIANQNNASENGVYVLDDSGLIRAEDLSSFAQLACGVLVSVVEGGSCGGKAFKIIPDGHEMLGTVNILVSEFAGWSSASPSPIEDTAFDKNPPETFEFS